MTTTPTPPPASPAAPSSDVLRFALTAAAWFIGLFGVLRLAWVERTVLTPMAQLQQRISEQLTGAPPGVVYADASCSGGDAMALCFGAIMAFPVTTWQARLRGAAMGLVVIAAFNVLRLGNLSLVASNRSLLDLLHVYVWPSILILVAVGYVYLWMSRQQRPARTDGPSVSPAHTAWHGPARRFLVLTVVGTGAYFAAAGWLYASTLLYTLSGWVAATGAALMTTVGVTASATGNLVRTAQGGFLVTQECIATPLIPVYVAAVLAAPLTRARRLVALGATPVIFFGLGVARLLVLALPSTLIASPDVAVHAFSQVLVAGLLVAGLAVWSARASDRPHPVRRVVWALGLGLVAAVAAGPLWSDLLHRAVASIQLLVQHGGHTLAADPQGAVAMLPAFQLGLVVALCGAVGARGPWWRHLPLVLGALAVLQLTVLLGLGELGHHVGLAPHTSLVRAGGLLAPLALVWLTWGPLFTTPPGLGAERTALRSTPRPA